MTTTSVADVMECGGRVTIEQVLIFVDVPLIVLLVLAVVFTALASMTSKKSSSVPGDCTMFLKMSSPAFFRNRRRLRDQVIFARVTDTDGKSSNWVEFNPRPGTIYLDLSLPSGQSRLSLVEMRITCPDTYHRPSPQYSQWSKSATSQLRRLRPLSIQSHRLDYQMDTTSSNPEITSPEGAIVVYHLTPRPIKSSLQDIIEYGCIVWLSLCLAGLLSFGITMYIDLAYPEFTTAVVLNAINILITTANVIVAIISGILAFAFVKILATPFRRYNSRQRRGKYRRINGRTLDRNVGDIKRLSPNIQPVESEFHPPVDSDMNDITIDRQSSFQELDVPITPAKLTREEDLLDDENTSEKLTLKSVNPSSSRHSLLASCSSLQSLSGISSVSYESEENRKLTNEPMMATAESSQLSNEIKMVAKGLPSTAPLMEATWESMPLVKKSKSLPSLPSQSCHSLTISTSHMYLDIPPVFAKLTTDTLASNLKTTTVKDEHQPMVATEVSSPLTNEPTISDEATSLPRSSESTESVSSTFTIESLPEELPGGVYQTEKYFYREISCPWFDNPWHDDHPFQSDVYLAWVNGDNKGSNNSAL